MTNPADRRLDMSLEIAASDEAVWKALTVATELERWFPLRAEVEPRVGGRYFISWENEWQSDGRIQIFEPRRHLRTTWPSELKGVELAVDYLLEASAGGTRLRLVHSGFGRDSAWDREFDGISVGWSFELRSLRHYLERHPGRPRHVVYLIAQTGLEPEAAFERMLREGFGAEPPSGLREGERYRLAVGAGDSFEGSVVDCRPPKQFAGTVAALDDALFRVECYGQSLNLWLAAWGDATPAAFDGYRRRWSETLARLFPQPAAARA